MEIISNFELIVDNKMCKASTFLSNFYHLIEELITYD